MCTLCSSRRIDRVVYGVDDTCFSLGRLIRIRHILKYTGYNYKYDNELVVLYLCQSFPVVIIMSVRYAAAYSHNILLYVHCTSCD